MRLVAVAVAVAVVGALGLAGCSGGDLNREDSVLGVAEKVDGGSGEEIVALAEKSDLEAALVDPDRKFTLLVPTEAAMAQVAKEAPQYIDDPDLAGFFFKSHLIEGVVEIEDGKVLADTIRTEGGLSFSVTDDGAAQKIGWAQVVGEPDIADNGIVISIDGALVPEMDPDGN